MMMQDNLGLMVLATDRVAGLMLLDASDEQQTADLLHAMLQMYAAAARETLSGLGILAIGCAIEELIETETSRDIKEASRLILAHSAARTPCAESDFVSFGAQEFNSVLERVTERGRYSDLIVSVAVVWRRLMPAWHTESGLEILRRVTW
jgi:hypothetical protein